MTDRKSGTGEAVLMAMKDQWESLAEENIPPEKCQQNSSCCCAALLLFLSVTLSGVMTCPAAPQQLEKPWERGCGGQCPEPMLCVTRVES